MKLAVVGATGNMGSRIVREALMRGHAVTAVIRDASRLPVSRLLTAAVADIGDVASMAAAFHGQDAVLHAYAPPRVDVDARIALQDAGTRAILAAMRQANLRRIVAVGGAGSSEIAPGVKLMDSVFIPQQFRGGVRSTARIREILAGEPDLDWTFICPPHEITVAERTGRYRTGKDALIVDEWGRSHISYADYAVAFIDEVEAGDHLRQRITTGW